MINIKKYSDATWSNGHFPDGRAVFERYVDLRNIVSYDRRANFRRRDEEYRRLLAAYKQMPDNLFKDHDCWFKNYRYHWFYVTQPYKDIEQVKEAIQATPKFVAACVLHDIKLTVIKLADEPYHMSAGWHSAGIMFLEMSVKEATKSSNDFFCSYKDPFVDELIFTESVSMDVFMSRPRP